MTRQYKDITLYNNLWHGSTGQRKNESLCCEEGSCCCSILTINIDIVKKKYPYITILMRMMMVLMTIKMVMMMLMMLVSAMISDEYPNAISPQDDLSIQLLPSIGGAIWFFFKNLLQICHNLYTWTKFWLQLL